MESMINFRVLHEATKAKDVMTRNVEFVAGHETRLAAGQTDRKIVHLVDHFAIDFQMPIGHEQSSLIIAHLDLGLNRHALGSPG